LGSRSLSAVGSVVLLAACISAPPSPSETGAAPPRDGTLRLGVRGDFPFLSLLAKSEPDEIGDPQAAIDPQRAGWYDSWELLRCCLVRTLLSYEGKPTDQGGTTLRHDLAESLPEVSEDGLTWTFKLRQGMHYAPPLQTVEITSADFVRSLRRLLPGIPRAFRPQIEGVAEYIAGDTTTISGLETPDPYTLRVRLTRPQGDLPARLAFPDMAPIPPHPADPAAQFGVATGHDEDYGRFLVASGPYMVEGAELIDFNAPLDQQVPASGFVPGESLTLVRNPEWDEATDALRPAFVERIEIAIGGTQEELAARVESGQLDLVLYSGPPPDAPIEQIERFRADQALGSVHANPRDGVRYIGLTMALPPFDDIHVRKAANLVINKARLIELSGGPWTGEVAGHIVLNSLEDNLLLTYDPYRTPGSTGDLAAAAAEMKLSGYDTDGDGICDDPACDELTGIILPPFAQLAEAVIADLEQIGIHAEVEVPDDAFARWFDPAGRTSFMVAAGYAKDHLSASTFFTANFDSRTSLSDEETNGTLIGATPEQLENWGYGPLEMPNIDDRIDLCHAQTGGAQVQCWAALDQYLMENVVPFVPFSFERRTGTVSARVVHYSFDQSIALPALDQIAVPPDP
jgi:peptide/nickel transport system substrate-binding protein